MDIITAMPQPALRTLPRSLRWLIPAAVAALIVATGLPGLATSVRQPLSLSLDRTVTLTSTDATQPATLSRHITTARIPETRTKGVAQVQLETHFRSQDYQVDIQRSVVLSRQSAYPDTSYSAGPDGLYTFFPAGTEQRSYPLVDEFSQAAYLADFSGVTTRAGLEVYSFAHHQPPVAGREVAAALGLPATMTLADGSTGTAYYSLSRELWVEPSTGTIVDAQENYALSYATAPDAAVPAPQVPSLDGTDSAAPVSPGPNSHLAWQATMAYDDSTIAELATEVRASVRTTTVTSIIATVAGTLALVLAVVAVVLLARQRRQ